MNTANNIQRKLTLSGILSIAMIAIVAFAFASKGGDDKKKTTPAKPDFSPINISNSFTLKSGISYMGSHIFSQQKEKGNFSMNTVITYQSGNTIYILPYKYKVNVSTFATPAPSNLQLLNLKIKVH